MDDDSGHKGFQDLRELRTLLTFVSNKVRSGEIKNDIAKEILDAVDPQVLLQLVKFDEGHSGILDMKQVARSVPLLRAQIQSSCPQFADEIRNIGSSHGR